jgi:hypothetical protein
VAVKIVNANPRFPKGKYIEPSPLGYIHIAADVEGRTKPGPVFRKSAEKRALLGRVKELAKQVAELDSVVRASVFQAAMFMPYTNYVHEHPELRRASFDVVVLVEPKTPELIPEVQATPEYKELLAELEKGAKSVHVMAAHNVKRVGEVDKSHQGLFAFNYFVADDAETMVDLWDYFAGWYQVKAGLTSSTLLVPVDGTQSDFVAVNNARWKYTMPPRMMSKPSFWTYVRPNLDGNQVGLMPVAYRLA